MSKVFLFYPRKAQKLSDTFCRYDTKWISQILNITSINPSEFFVSPQKYFALLLWTFNEENYVHEYKYPWIQVITEAAS
jgi:hypothetical protein